MQRLDGDDTEMEKPKGIRKVKGGKGFTGYKPGVSSMKGTKPPGPDPPALLHLLQTRGDNFVGRCTGGCVGFGRFKMAAGT